uniref:Myosin motor domain-containing protein n=1 Tax=Globisporangium ultimum (strain ATCC 200006 / CBS 805.95 / DAOM BR144) TaxID=431595 RepID=K3WNC1_GLOUD
MEGIKVYAPDTEHVWLPGVITQARGKNVIVRLENLVSPDDAEALDLIPAERELKSLQGSEREIRLDDPLVLKTLQGLNTANGGTDEATLSLPLQNASDSSSTSLGFEDMITIDHLHEASILHNLRRRFFRKLPYTYTGKICIAVNPYQWLNLYDKSIMERFSDGKREDKPPHVYAVSMEAFFNMRTKKEDQSILVSGESGAGKTETTKIVMSHLAALASNSNSKVIQQIIKANPLLESFGNAKTVRNDNSSRFGKFTELQFTQDAMLIGARSRTYLLEKSRVTTQADGERNFHIFYQLLSKRNQFPDLELSGQQTFKYVSDKDNSVPLDEEGDLDRTREALELVGIDKNQQQEILQILAAILHLGETSFCAANGDVDASQLVDKKPFAIACKLLGVEVSALERAVCNRNVFVGREVILKPMTSDQATDCRDALAKSLYSKLFLWLVDQINETIGVKTKDAVSFIGILDIFGFEHFETNSFEQFCINYANEKLQQKFVQDVLKTVQLEYEEENISWSHIQFADNQDVLNLIEGRLGVISFLNEESLLVTGTDAAFASLETKRAWALRKFAIVLQKTVRCYLKMENEKKNKALGLKVAQLQLKLDRKQQLPNPGAKLSPSAAKARAAAPTPGDAHPNQLGGSLRGSMLSNQNHRLSASSGILDESQEVITALHDENEKLRRQLEQQEEEIQKLKNENRTLKNWQKSKEVDEKVQKMAHRDQETRISHAKSKVSTKGSNRRVKEQWEEIRNFPPPMHYTLGSLIIPKLAERPDIQVHVHTKEFIGTSMRITLSQLEKATAGSVQRLSSIEDAHKVCLILLLLQEAKAYMRESSRLWWSLFTQMC